MRRYEAALFVALAALALLWPAIVNGGPFWFPDTTTYIRGADAAMVSTTGKTSEWSDRLVLVESDGGASGPAADDSDPAIEVSRPVLTGRSIYYGLTLYLPMIAAGTWAAIGFQALMVAGLIAASLGIAARRIGVDARVIVPASFVVLVLLTPLPYFTSMMMPDVYSGVMILMLATAICCWDGMTGRERVLLTGASAAAATFHSSHILIALALGGGAFVLGLWGTRLRAIALVLPVAAVGLLGEAAFSHAVEARTGEAPLSPPFLSARLTSEGPGAEYLNRHCAGGPDDFTLCAYRNRLPEFSDDFLWSEDEANGLFQLVGKDEQRRIASEDKRFFLAVAADDPAGFIGASVSAFARQLVAFNLANFNYSHMKGGTADKFPDSVEPQLRQSRAFAGDMPVAFTVWATAAAAAGSILLIAVQLLRSLRRRQPLPLHLRYALLMVLGVLANAMVCGMLSKPGARYQMRLIWLVPAAAAIAASGGRAVPAPGGVANGWNGRRRPAAGGTTE